MGHAKTSPKLWFAVELLVSCNPNTLAGVFRALQTSHVACHRIIDSFWRVSTVFKNDVTDQIKLANPISWKAAVFSCKRQICRSISRGKPGKLLKSPSWRVILNGEISRRARMLLTPGPVRNLLYSFICQPVFLMKGLNSQPDYSSIKAIPIHSRQWLFLLLQRGYHKSKSIQSCTLISLTTKTLSRAPNSFTRIFFRERMTLSMLRRTINPHL